MEHPSIEGIDFANETFSCMEHAPLGRWQPQQGVTTTTDRVTGQTPKLHHCNGKRVPRRIISVVILEIWVKMSDLSRRFMLNRL